MVFYWRLSDCKSLQNPRSFLSILTVLNNVVVWIFPTRPLISESSSLFNNPSLNVLKALITIGIIVTFMFHILFSIPYEGRGTYPFFHFHSILLCGQPG